MRGEASQQPKRGNRPSLSLQQKLEAIRRVTINGDSKASVARDLGVPESTLRGWCKSEDKILGALKNTRQSQSPDSISYSPASGSASPTDDEDVMAAPAVKKMKCENLINADNVNLHSAISPVINQTLASDSQAVINNMIVAAYYHSVYSNAVTNLITTPINPTVNFVDNGLQYQNKINESTGNGNINYFPNGTNYNADGASTSKSALHASAVVTPTTSNFVHTWSASRQSLSPAAEPPSTPIPLHQVAQFVNSATSSNNGSLSREPRREGINHLHYSRKIWENSNPKTSQTSVATTPKRNENVWQTIKNFDYSIHNQQLAQASTSSMNTRVRTVTKVTTGNSTRNSNDYNIIIKQAAVNNTSTEEANSKSSTTEECPIYSLDEATKCAEGLLKYLSDLTDKNITRFEVETFGKLVQKLQNKRNEGRVEPINFKHSRK